MEDIIGGKKHITLSSRANPFFNGIGQLKAGIRIHQLHDQRAQPPDFVPYVFHLFFQTVIFPSPKKSTGETIHETFAFPSI